MQSNRAIHIRFFKWLIYGSPKRSNISTGIKVSIHIVSAVFTFKRFIISLTNVFAYRTCLARICRFNNYQKYTIEQTFVSQERTKLREIPTTKFCSELFVSSFGSKTNVSQILNGNSFTLFFCTLYNRFTDSVIDNFCRSSFFPTKPFQKFFTSFSAF